ncbi:MULTISPECIES: hypothetical protein [Bacillati]|uniref:hypothetical protein n=1 Tax=Bacillati TaxID=1783272 RepID=UPI0011404F4F|nr:MULTISPECIES: hypothetical protein [Terrabacteria group]MED3677073.1 hypothetical protein [Bacillus velezensis]
MTIGSKLYSIGFEHYFRNVFLKIHLGEFETTDTGAINIANSAKVVLLFENCIEIHFNDGLIKTLYNSDSNNFKFRINTKNPLPSSVDIEVLNDYECSVQVSDISYQEQNKDLKDVSWNIEEAFNEMKKIFGENGERYCYMFSSMNFYAIPLY